MQIFNFNKKSNAIIMVRSHKTSTFACQLQKRNYSLSLKSLTYTSLRLSGVPYFFRQADYCLLFFWMTLVLYLIHVSLIWKTACNSRGKTNLKQRTLKNSIRTFSHHLLKCDGERSCCVSKSRFLPRYLQFFAQSLVFMWKTQA